MLKVPTPLGVSPLDPHSYPSRTPTPPAMDILELAPGRGVGPLRLGDSLWAVLDTLRARKAEVPKIEVSWDPDNAPTSAVTVHAGLLTLLFPAPAQWLAHILIPTADGVTLTYEGTVLASPSHPLTRAGVARALGPTFADSAAGSGSSAGSRTGSRLTYPGISFRFAGAGGNRDAVMGVSVTPREEDGEVVPSDAVRQVTLNPGRGATLSLPAGDVEIELNSTTAQDVLLDLGPPLRKYWKEDDRMDRMWVHSDAATAVSTPSACFWNYFQHGLDLLVVDGVVTKIIVHSNIPGTPQFQEYARCPWAVQTDGGELDMSSPLSAFRSQLLAEPGAASATTASPASPPAPSPADLLTPEPSQSKKKKKGKADGSRTPSPSTPAVAAQPAAGPSATLDAHEAPPDAMLFDRSVEGGLEGVLGMSRSQLVGFAGLVLEVDEGSGAVVAVQVWG